MFCMILPDQKVTPSEISQEDENTIAMINKLTQELQTILEQKALLEQLLEEHNRKEAQSSASDQIQEEDPAAGALPSAGNASPRNNTVLTEQDIPQLIERIHYLEAQLAQAQATISQQNAQLQSAGLPIAEQPDQNGSLLSNLLQRLFAYGAPPHENQNRSPLITMLRRLFDYEGQPGNRNLVVGPVRASRLLTLGLIATALLTALLSEDVPQAPAMVATHEHIIKIVTKHASGRVTKEIIKTMILGPGK